MLVTLGARDSSVSMKPMPMQVSIWYVYMCKVLQKYNGGSVHVQSVTKIQLGKKLALQQAAAVVVEVDG
jgi:hypothetical protein